MTINKDDFSVGTCRDGAVFLQCSRNGGMEFDLVFASGAMAGDPDLIKQKAILGFILDAIHKS